VEILLSNNDTKIAVLEERVEAALARIDDLERDRKSFFRWGLMALGSLITATIGFLLKDHVR